jgi:putative PIN family toxin of toxin-antitoxin system
LKAVVDTNIFISYCLGNENASKLMDFIISNKWQMYADSRLMHEYATIPLREKFKFSSDKIQSLKNLIVQNIINVDISTDSIKFNPDRQDSKILEIANLAGCEYIISNDKQLLRRAGHLTKSKLIDCNGFVELFCKI